MDLLLMDFIQTFMDLMVSIFYSDEFVIDVETGMVTK
jgi:hypothetical protein